jgi:ketosteroid isomerase-like protein
MSHPIASPRLVCFSLCLCAASALRAQSSPALPGAANPPSPGLASPLAAPSSASSMLSQPALTPGALFLMELERRFAAEVAAGGGKAFAAWFAEDAVSLSNGKPAVLGRGAIAAMANWDPKVYQLTWTPTAAEMGPSNDMGFTWGHFEGRTHDAQGGPVLVTGRYMTVWRKLPDGSWKVAMDASAAEPPASGDCCVLPKP